MAAPALSPPPLSTPLGGPSGAVGPTWARWLSQLQSLIAGALHPTTPKGAQQAGALYMGTGAPSNADGADGDFYLRTDTPGTANQRLYVRAGGSWTGLL